MADAKKPFKFNTVLNKNRVAEKNKLIALNRIIREKLSNVSKCVLYCTDKDAPLIIQIPSQQEREYAVITIFDNTNGNFGKFDLEVKVTQGTLTLNKYKVLATKKFNTKDGPICKMVVKLV